MILNSAITMFLLAVNQDKPLGLLLNALPIHYADPMFTIKTDPRLEKPIL